mgnify:CR=1 FL=1
MKNGPLRPSWRFVLGAALLVVLALYSGFQSLQYYDISVFIRRYKKFGTIASDSISRFENRLACVRAELAPDERVGFITPLKGDKWTEVYLWTQYALAPVIVTREETQSKFIAVYPDAQSLKQAATAGYEILVDCNNGVGLLRGKQ